MNNSSNLLIITRPIRRSFSDNTAYIHQQSTQKVSCKGHIRLYLMTKSIVC